MAEFVLPDSLKGKASGNVATQTAGNEGAPCDVPASKRGIDHDFVPTTPEEMAAWMDRRASRLCSGAATPPRLGNWRDYRDGGTSPSGPAVTRRGRQALAQSPP